ncbi:hypothetical protein PHYPSEUDO_014966 [Phytophthora pseudosyringae]|uniref:BZIP domain-containing protein n=1 Tax=Phytophthora pseudosyringae TaxID=221518 RepID=A0A8T1V3L5_9STRA|nr:hypothetical protein PHYPSEUDO_014966 [Phytophthora pseudosyringae]
MASSFLCPPNSDSLSDEVIGNVVQRVGSIFTNDNDDRGQVSRSTHSRQAYSSNRVLVDSYSATGSGAHSMINQLPSESVVGRKRLPDLADVPRQPNGEVASYTAEEALTKARKMKVPASRRERCRINQARYRMRQRHREEELDKGIRQVEEQIQELETQRQNIMMCATTNESMWSIATEYFRLFRYGYLAPMTVPELSSAASSGWLRTHPAKQAHAQLDYLRAAMAPDVTDGNVSGAEALLENWKLLSLHHSDVQLQLKRLDQVGQDSLLASTATSVIITENTLRDVYPHLAGSLLEAKLLNQRLVMRGSVRFYWDASCGRVGRIESKVDVLTPMLELLGNLEEVACVFEKALITPDGRIVVKEDAIE